MITALLLGVLSTKYEKLRSWAAMSICTVGGSLLVLGSMLLIVEHLYGPPTPPKFASTDDMMTYFANEASKWVKKDKGIDLDYSLDSIKVIEDQLNRLSGELNKAKPQQGSFGTAMAYGAYIGEVFRRRFGGSWAVDHPDAGTRSYPLTTKSNVTIFPVGWCCKRLTGGEDENVYAKAVLVAEKGGAFTNTARHVDSLP